MPFKFEDKILEGVKLITPDVFADGRGGFWECFKKTDFETAGINEVFVQDNCSISQKGVLRGLHYQRRPKSQGKLVRVLHGAIFDVAVDIRPESKKFGQWVSEILSSENKKMLWIPEGFAHGFLALEDNTEIHYKISGAEYSKEHECSICWNDTEIGIDWPVDRAPVIAEKDKAGMHLNQLRSNLINS